MSGKNIRTKRLSKKLDQRFNSPYLVVEWIGSQAYCLKPLQQAGSTYEVFHVLLLELYISNWRTVLKPLPPIEIDGEEEYKLKKIL